VSDSCCVHGTNKLTFHEQDEYQAYCEDEIVHRVLQFSGRRRTTTADQWAIASRGVIRLIRRVSFFQSLSGPLVSLLSSASPPQLRLCIFFQWSAKSRFYFFVYFHSILFCFVLFHSIPFSGKLVRRLALCPRDIVYVQSQAKNGRFSRDRTVLGKCVINIGVAESTRN
jgi:hypothetical protein